MTSSQSDPTHDKPTVGDILAGPGEMRALMRALDWTKTPMGPPSGWPQSLKTAVGICLASRFPMILWWGDDLTVLYNDAYRPILGQKHPRALGRPGLSLDAWGDEELREVIGPMLRGVIERGQATWSDDELLILVRQGYPEETYFTYSYSPIPDEGGGVGGVFTAVTETTLKVIDERRLKVLRELSARAAEAKKADGACAEALSVLRANPRDVPYCLLYLLDEEGAAAFLAGQSGLPPDHPAAPTRVALRDPEAPWPFADALARGGVVEATSPARFGHLPGAPWPEPSRCAVVLPLIRRGEGRPYGFLVAGTSPRLPFDDAYRAFLELIAGHIASAIANANAYEEERRRAEALAEIDLAKTTFFSNVSHEFRTPLTLMLGPVEDALASPERALSGESLETVHRNARRLLKLVNALLDFSRVEAGRMQASYAPTDLAKLTTELVSIFRSAVESAGLALVIDCQKLPERAYVDREMWEKIVLNLLSNALKFTFAGHIRVALEARDGQAVLSVEDTGTGIPPAELPNLFKRFHRVEGARSRTHEGSGIGLALVQELAKMHGGSIDVTSELGRGSTFSVSIPFGSAHLPQDRIRELQGAASVVSASTFLDEARRWLPASEAPASVPPAAASTPDGEASPPARVLLADDNADMRAYVARLLRREGFAIEAFADGAAARDAALLVPPDLVLTDVMMPKLDGFGLLEALRADARTRTVPVIMLSARAGEEARVEGFAGGADDYLVKPFSARELVARVTAYVELSRLRRAKEEALRDASLRKDEFLAMLAHELRNPLAPMRTALKLLEPKFLPGERARRYLEVLDRQTTNLTRLVEDLLDVSRITRGRIDLRMERLEVQTIVKHALEASRTVIDASSHAVNVTAPREPLWVTGDAVRLEQVMVNLLTNAAKYTNRGGQIWVTVERAGDTVELRVKDSGMGIDPAMLGRVFGLFEQAKRALDRSQGGLGIGLTVVKTLVELHSGTIEATSPGLGKGSSFVVRLPLAPADAPAEVDAAGAQKLPTPGAPAASPLRVLVVDDNRDAAETLAELLASEGHAVASAHDGPTALQLAEETPPDLVLLDIGLPGMDGYEVARHLRKSAAGQRALLVALTGYGQESDREQALKAGFDHHLVKPVDVDALEAIVQGMKPRG